MQMQKKACHIHNKNTYFFEVNYKFIAFFVYFFVESTNLTQMFN